MITPSHLVYNLFALGRQDAPAVRAAVIAGALLPDSATYLFFVITRFVQGYPQAVIWNDLYFNSAWRPFFDLSHSLLLWPLLGLAGFAAGWSLLKWIGASASMHAVMDMFVHANDAYAHFWPLSSWRFQSPISYWDPTRYGDIFSTIDAVVVLTLIAMLLMYYTRHWATRTALGLLALPYLATLTTDIWGLVFTL